MRDVILIVYLAPADHKPDMRMKTGLKAVLVLDGADIVLFS
jgi:hypothetical protein